MAIFAPKILSLFSNEVCTDGKGVSILCQVVVSRCYQQSPYKQNSVLFVGT